MMLRFIKPLGVLVFTIVVVVFYQNCGSKFETQGNINLEGSLSNGNTTDALGSTSIKDLAILNHVNLNKKSYIGDGIDNKIRVVNTKTKKILNINSDGSIPGENVRVEFVWYKDGQKIINHNSVSSRFRLTNLNNDSKGTYSVGAFLYVTNRSANSKINAHNGLIVQETDRSGEQIGSKLEFMKLDVFVPPAQKISPIIVDSSKSQILKFGQSVVLSVKGDGYPMPSYQWKKDGKILEGQDTDELVLYNLVHSDQGVYTCVLKNEVGETEIPSILISLEGQNVAAKVATTFLANYEIVLNDPWTSPMANTTGNPFPTKKWYKDNVLLNITGSELNIPTASFSDSGVYKIEAINSGGIDSKEFNVTVVCPAGQGRSGNGCIVNEMACDIANGQGKKILNNGTYGPCQVASCLAGFHSENNLCLPNAKSCVISGGTGGSGKMFWNFDTLQYSSCSLENCSSNTQHLENGACVEDIQSCQISNGIGYKAWNGSAYSSCKAQSCNESYHIENESCMSNQKVCNLPNADSSRQTWNGTTYGLCTVVACMGTFHKEGNACESNIKTCEANGGNGFATWDITTNQFSACMISSCKNASTHIENNICVEDPTCSSASHLSEDRKSCEANSVKCTLSDGSMGVKIWDTLIQRYSECAINTRKVLVFTPTSGDKSLSINMGNLDGATLRDQSNNLANHILFFPIPQGSDMECPYTIYENSKLSYEATQESNFSNLYDFECGGDLLSTTPIYKLIEASCVAIVPASVMSIHVSINSSNAANMSFNMTGDGVYKKYRVECQ